MKHGFSLELLAQTVLPYLLDQQDMRFLCKTFFPPVHCRSAIDKTSEVSLFSTQKKSFHKNICFTQTIQVACEIPLDKAEHLSQSAKE